MNLQPGNTVVHPHHGPATVVGRFARTVRGESVKYVDLAVHGGTLKVSVPAARADEIGIRDLPDSGELHRFAEVLCGPSTPEESQWSRRIKAQRELLISGDPVKLAGLVRDLLRRWYASRRFAPGSLRRRPARAVLPARRRIPRAPGGA